MAKATERALADLFNGAARPGDCPITCRSGSCGLGSHRRGSGGLCGDSVRTDHVEGTTISPVPYLEGWYVSERFRGQGVGRALLAFAEEWAVAKGYGELASDSEIENKAGIDLHKSVGFREVGRTVHFVKSLLRDDAQ